MAEVTKTYSKAAFINEATGNHYTVEVNEETGERRILTVYLNPKFKHEYKTAKNAKKSRYTVCECELKTSAKGVQYYKETIQQGDILREAGRD